MTRTSHLEFHTEKDIVSGKLGGEDEVGEKFAADMLNIRIVLYLTSPMSIFHSSVDRKLSNIEFTKTQLGVLWGIIFLAVDSIKYVHNLDVAVAVDVKK